MRADVSLRNLFVFIFLILCVRKSDFLTTDGFSITIGNFSMDYMENTKQQTFIYSSLFATSKHKHVMLLSRKNSWYIMLLLLCGDIEKCPGPVNLLRSMCETRGLKIAHLNIQAISSSFEGICQLLDLNKEIDILTLSETHLTQNIPDELYKIPGYNFVRHDRKIGPGGGVAIYIKKGLTWKRRSDLELFIASFYRPPNSSKYLQNDFTNRFNDLLSKVTKEQKETIILGDLNTDFIKNNDVDNIKHTLTINGFSQLIKQPTRITINTSTLIDIIATNKTKNIKKAEVRKQNNIKYEEKIIKSRNYSRYNPEKLQNDLKNVNFSSVFNATNVNDAVQLFTDILSNVFNKHAPIVKKRLKGKPTPWLNVNIKADMDRRDKILRKARKTKNEGDWRLYKKLRNYCNNRLKNARKAYYKNLLNENAKSFGDYFFTAVSKLKEIYFRATDLTWKVPRLLQYRTKTVFKFEYVSVIFIQKQLRSLNRNKASGMDYLPPGLLKDSAAELSKPLAYIINLSITTSTFPTLWKLAKIAPIHKSGNINEESSYRPISVLPVLSKVLEKAIHLQVTNYLEKNKLLTKYQFGYRANRSTELAATLFLDEVRREIDNGKLVGAVFMDLSRAFDTLGHSTLLSKLKTYGINGSEIKWFSDYLFGRKQCIQLGTELSPVYPVFTGVPQGSLLGPLLFIIYFNDFADCLTYSKVVMYADDTVVYFSHKDFDKIESCLNKDFANISNYLYLSELVINLNKGKTESMLFSTSKRLSKLNKNLEIKFNETTIRDTKTYEYLGNLVDSSVNMNKNFENRYKKAAARIRLLQKVRPYINETATEKVYNMMIVPLLTYCCLLKIPLTKTQILSFESVENRASKIIHGNQKSVNKVVSIKKQRDIKACMTVHKCLSGQSCSPFKDYFELGQRSTNSPSKRV